MKLKDIKKIVYGSYKVYLKRETHNYVGYCCRNRSGSMIVSINAKLNGMAYDLVLKHELGHIYYRHFEHMEDDRKTVKDLVKSKFNKNISLSKCHRIINIAQDIVIHDSILEKQEVEFLDQLISAVFNKEMKSCTSEGYDAPPLLTYPEYYEYILKKIFKQSQNQVGLPNDQANDGSSNSNNSSGDGSGDSDDQDDQDGSGDSKGQGDSSDGQDSDGSSDGSSGNGSYEEVEDDHDPIEGDTPFDEVDESDSDTERNGGVLQESEDETAGGPAGKGHNSTKTKLKQKDPYEELAKILKERIYKISDTTSMAIDSFRKYSRMNLKDGLLRKSIRLKDTKSITRFPVVLYVDNSGSMSNVISCIVSTIIDCNAKGYVHKDSVLVLCSTRIDFESKLIDIKEMPAVDLGGTDLSGGLKSTLEKYPKNQVIMISDFADGNSPRLAGIIHENKNRITTIICSNESTKFGPYKEDFDFHIF